jgi:hypothetical protein
MAVFAKRFRVDLVFFFFYAEDGGDIFLWNMLMSKAA